MKFIDEVEIEVSAGRGGSGCKSFRREKFVPLGGPDGGNGGNGGSIILKADHDLLTLLDFRFRPSWKAEDGNPGEGGRREGKRGSSIIVKVPVGTEVLDPKNGELIVDLAEDGAEYVIAKGGRGGKGNDFFKSPTNRAPEKFQPGEEGEQKLIKLSLKLVADVALVGLPNAGKSTLISRLSDAKPKIADYPFTTLVPNLGVVRLVGDKSIVIADIPGLIEGAHQGKGLGIRFLKHIERTRVLLHLIDISSIGSEENPEEKIWETYLQIYNELASFSDELIAKPQIVVLTKTDTISDKDLLKKFCSIFVNKGLECLSISSASGENIPDLLKALTHKVFPAH